MNKKYLKLMLPLLPLSTIAALPLVVTSCYSHQYDDQASIVIKKHTDFFDFPGSARYKNMISKKSPKDYSICDDNGKVTNNFHKPEDSSSTGLSVSLDNWSIQGKNHEGEIDTADKISGSYTVITNASYSLVADGGTWTNDEVQTHFHLDCTDGKIRINVNANATDNKVFGHAKLHLVASVSGVTDAIVSNEFNIYVIDREQISKDIMANTTAGDMAILIFNTFWLGHLTDIGFVQQTGRKTSDLSSLDINVVRVQNATYDFNEYHITIELNFKADGDKPAQTFTISNQNLEEQDEWKEIDYIDIHNIDIMGVGLISQVVFYNWDYEITHAAHPGAFHISPIAKEEADFDFTGYAPQNGTIDIYGKKTTFDFVDLEDIF